MRDTGRIVAVDRTHTKVENIRALKWDLGEQVHRLARPCSLSDG